MSQAISNLSHRTPPGPRGDWLLGSAHDFQQDLLGTMLRMQREHGDVVRYRFALWYGYLVNHPDGVKRILQDNNRNYNKDTFSFNLLRPMLGNGLLTSEGDVWLRQRRLAQPAFHRQRIAAFGTIMTEAALAMLERWQIAAACGEPLDASKEMMRLTLRIAGLTLFSLDISGEADVVGRAFTEASEYVAHASLDPLALLLTGFPMPAQLRFRAALRALDKVVQGIITERRRQNRDTGDLLSMYLLARDEETGEGMNDRQLRDEVMTLLLAGHETTANTLAWTWYLLSGHPVIEQKLHAELAAVLGGRVPTVPDLPNLPYTRMVIEESMRLYPPAYGISRKAIAADEIGGYRIPANSVIFVSPYVMHRHPKFWENPDVFDPERFTPERSADRPPFAYFPFGGGPRLCIGNQFALIEAQLLLATVAQRYALRLVPGQPVAPEPLITLRPRNGLPMTLHPRSG